MVQGFTKEFLLNIRKVIRSRIIKFLCKNSAYFFALLIIVVIIAAYGYLRNPASSFWDTLVATGIALIGGIPTALWVDRIIKSREESLQYKNDRQREENILNGILEELQTDSTLHSQQKACKEGAMIIQQIKTDFWQSLLLSGEVKYIGDVVLLNTISKCYYFLNIVKRIEEQAHLALRTSAIIFTDEKGVKKNAMIGLLEDARKLDQQLESAIEQASKATTARLSEIK